MRFFPLHPDRKGKKSVLVEDERWLLVHAALIPLNGVMCGSLALYGFLATQSTESWVVLYLIPGGKSHRNHINLLCLTQVLPCLSIAMLGAILLARQVMLSVDLSGLKDLQYEYKGA